MKCGSCGRTTLRKQLPRGWRCCGRLVYCRSCRRRQFRLRVFSMSIREVDRIVLETPDTLRIPVWAAAMEDGRPILRFVIGATCWVLPVNHAVWSAGRKEVFHRLVSGRALTGDLWLTAGERGVVCKTVVWMPRTETTPLRPSMRQRPIEQISNHDLRGAIRASVVSFPAQVPSFPSREPDDLQRRMVQLYFLLGWSIVAIAARYRVTPQQAGRILSVWKSAAARAGYLQHIPPCNLPMVP